MKSKLLPKLSRLLLMGVLACETPELDKVNNLNGGRILVIGHGGSGFQTYTNPLPANSMASVERAIDGLQADGVEVDVQLSADKQLVLFHDGRLENRTNCFGCVSDQPAAEILTCRYNRHVGSNFGNREPVVQLSHVLAKFSTYHPKPIVFIDTKIINACTPASTPAPQAFADALAELILQYKAQPWTYVESTSIEMLLRLQQKHQGFRLLLYTRNVAPDLPQAIRHGFDGITTFNDDITKQQVAEAHLNGLYVTLLGVRSRSSLLEAIKKHPDAIQTDNIPLMQEILRHGL